MPPAFLLAKVMVPVMLELLFSRHGRLNRAPFWLAHLLLFALAVGNVILAMGIVALGSLPKQGGGAAWAMSIIAFIVAGIVAIGGLLTLAGSAICLGIRRYHDRDKPAIWVAIQFVPIIGAFWYFIETGFLAGTVGSNQYGSDPLGSSFHVAATRSPATPVGTPPHPTGVAPHDQEGVAPPRGGRPGWITPVMLTLALPGLLVILTSAVVAWRNHVWLAGATKVAGHIVGVEPVNAAGDPASEPKRTSYRAIISAITPDGTIVRVVDDWAVNPAPAIGAEREIAYDQSGPGHAVSVNYWDFYGWPSLLAVLAAVFGVPWLFATALVVLFWKRRPTALPKNP